MCNFRSVSVFIATVFLISWSTAANPICQEPVQRSNLPAAQQKPSGASQEILELRARLGGGVGTILSDSGLSQAAEQTFTQELERLQKSAANQEPKAISPSTNPQMPSVERRIPEFSQPQSSLNIPLQSGRDIPLQRGPNNSLQNSSNNPAFSQVQNGFNQNPQQGSPHPARQPVNLDRLRHFARNMESIASDMEDSQLYDLADRLRSEAQQLRLRARSMNR
jgi:hypothetical protein